MSETKRHSAPLPRPIEMLESYFRDGGVSLLHAVFENSFFPDPDVVRLTPTYCSSSVRASRTHYPGKKKNDNALWNGRAVRLYTNARAQTAWTRYTGRQIARRSGYGVRHVWGHPWNPDAFTAGWNLCYMPFWAGMLTENQHPHELVEKAIRQASFDLYFRTRPVCAAPSFVSDPGLNLAEHLGGRPILILGKGTAGKKPKLRGTPAAVR